MLKSSKKGNFSLAVVVSAVLALVVLVVLILIFTGRIGIFNKGMSQCPAGSSAQAEPCENGIPLHVIDQNERGKTDTVLYCCTNCISVSSIKCNEGCVSSGIYTENKTCGTDPKCCKP